MEARITMSETDLQMIKTELAVILQRLSSVEKELEKVKDGSTWLIRLVVGTVILGLLSQVIVQ